MPAVSVSHLEKHFTRRREGKKVRSTALGGVSLSIDRGECVALLGQNGSGKSTLVRILSTLLLPDSGRAEVFGHDVVRDPAAVRRVVNRVSVEASFFKRMSATENLSYAARFYGLTPSQTRVQVPAILENVGFPRKRALEPMEDLSRGMQQKVALARALLTSPVLLLLDEPTTGLDPRSKREVQAFIQALRAEHGTTVLICTHDMEEAAALADRVGIIHAGRLLSLAPTPEILGRYGARDLDEAFFTATGRELGDEDEDDDEPGPTPREELTR
jgi:ABC-2 type transport system ATP-binding protein